MPTEVRTESPTESFRCTDSPTSCAGSNAAVRRTVQAHAPVRGDLEASRSNSSYETVEIFQPIHGKTSVVPGLGLRDQLQLRRVHRDPAGSDEIKRPSRRTRARPRRSRCSSDPADHTRSNAPRLPGTSVMSMYRTVTHCRSTSSPTMAGRLGPRCPTSVGRTRPTAPTRPGRDRSRAPRDRGGRVRRESARPRHRSRWPVCRERGPRQSQPPRGRSRVPSPSGACARRRRGRSRGATGAAAAPRSATPQRPRRSSHRSVARHDDCAR